MAHKLKKATMNKLGIDREDLTGQGDLGTPSDAMHPSAAESGTLSRRQVSSVQRPKNGPASGTFTVEEAVEAAGFGWFQAKLSLFTGVVWMADAMEMMILSILGPALHCEWLILSWQQALITSVVFGGMMLSSGIWGKISDKYGRKAELLMCSTFTFFYGMLSAVSPNYIWMLILRGLVGVGIGGVPQSITMYAEFLPQKQRAKCVVLIVMFWAVGTCFIVLIAVFIMPTIGWRYLLGCAALPVLIFVVSCFWLPESPRFDIARNEPEKALATLKRVAKDNGKELPPGKLIEDVTDIDLETGKVKRGQFRDVFVPELRVTTFLLFGIWFANAFAYYGIVLMTTELFVIGDKCHGGTGEKSMSEPACPLECKGLSKDDYLQLLWTTAAEFPGLIGTFLVIEWLGRKWTMAVTFFIFAAFVYLINICVTRAILTTFIFVARGAISGSFQAAYVYTPEVYPTTTRAVGMGMCSGVARIGALITPFFAQVLLRTSVYLAACIYGTIGVIGGILALLLPIETTNRKMMTVLKPSTPNGSSSSSSQNEPSSTHL